MISLARVLFLAILLFVPSAWDGWAQEDSDPHQEFDLAVWRLARPPMFLMGKTLGQRTSETDTLREESFEVRDERIALFRINTDVNRITVKSADFAPRLAAFAESFGQITHAHEGATRLLGVARVSHQY